MSEVLTERRDAALVVTLNRPEVRNAVNPTTAARLLDVFADFDGDDSLAVAVVTGAGGTFCAGADLRSAAGEGPGFRLQPDGPGPMGFSRLLLSKPVIAAVEGHAVAGGLELALWCDLRVAAADATFGVYCRRFGVPLIDGGTVRLPRLIGHGRALDMILTGRGVHGDEALAMGLVNRLTPPGGALAEAMALAQELADLPQACLRSDLLSAHEQWGLSVEDALRNEFAHGLEVLESGASRDGARRFVDGAGRHGAELSEHAGPEQP